MPDFTHIDEQGRSRMVDVGDKAVTKRRARAGGTIRMSGEAFRRVIEGSVPKGDVFAAVRIAGIMAAKETASLIPLCHQIPLDTVGLEVIPGDGNEIRVEATVEATWKTGVEMEALVAVTAALLTFYDMCKAIDRTMVIGDVALLEKSGGRSGDFRREDKGGRTA